MCKVDGINNSVLTVLLKYFSARCVYEQEEQVFFRRVRPL